MRALPTIDAVLREAAATGGGPGGGAMAATDRGVIYQGAFGRRALPAGSAMTLDTVFRVASMTKAVTSVAAMQLVERGRLALDAPVPGIDPALASPQVLEGFDPAGTPILRPARRPITLRHLLTHTAGFSYAMWNPHLDRYIATSGTPPLMTGRSAALSQPLVFDPGDKWEYGINIDWVGRIVEALSGQDLEAYCREHIFDPLGMADTTYLVSPEQRARQAARHQRGGDGSLTLLPFEPFFASEYYAGGGGLYSTGGDYLKFLRALLHGGSLGDATILTPPTVALMGENQIGALPAGVMKTANPELTNDVDFFPGARVRWGLGYMLTLDPGPNGRGSGSVTWAGLFNTYYWIDPARKVTGLIMTQVLPFADPTIVTLYGRFERELYATLDAA